VQNYRTNALVSYTILPPANIPTLEKAEQAISDAELRCLASFVPMGLL